MNMRSMSHARMSFSCRDGRWVPMGASGCVGSGGVERRMHSTYAFRSLVRVPACGYFWLLLHDRVCRAAGCVWLFLLSVSLLLSVALHCWRLRWCLLLCALYLAAHISYKLCTYAILLYAHNRVHLMPATMRMLQTSARESSKENIRRAQKCRNIYTSGNLRIFFFTR